jgi:hypothetical protein
VVGLLIRHLGHIAKMGLTDSPVDERCLEKYDSATHVQHECQVIACLKVFHVSPHFMQSDDCHDATSPHSKYRKLEGLSGGV